MVERWAKRVTGVPRGLLRFLVLNMLLKKPMSGVEIVEVIERETEGKWKPSSGSIYPLLAWLHKKGYTTESPNKEMGLKRYTLTAKGKAFFEKQISFGQKMLDKLEFIIPLLISGFQFCTDEEKALYKAREPARRVVMALLKLRPTKFKPTEQEAKEIERILKQTADELEELVQKANESYKFTN
ncbi:MAG: PadR family transcriptional regulator [Candidatus Bathyarchaeota archaeon]|nr:PadR family transcriptional regulator [Candidatus Bathyarchaeota archaeon]